MKINKNPDANTGTGERLAFTAAEASQMLGVNRKTLYRLCARGELFRAPALRTVLIPRWSLKEFLRNAGK
jgi:excisionase family DNA binding protein